MAWKRIAIALTILLFPLSLLAQGDAYNMDMYTLSLTKEKVCVKQKVLWGFFKPREGKDSYFCFALKNENVERCYRLGTRRYEGDLDVIESVDNEGQPYAITYVMKDGITIWISHSLNGLPAWVLSTHSICNKEVLNFLTIR